MRYLHMGQPTLELLLETAGEDKLKSLPLVVKALRICSITPFKLSDSANKHLEKLRTNEPDVLEKTVKEILTPEKKGSLNNCVTYLMVVMMVIMSVGFAGTNIYISLSTKTIIEWYDMLMPLIGPVFIVWYDRGILRKENKDMLMALLGQAPQLTMMESISRRIAPKPPRVHQEVIEEHTQIDKRTTDY